MKHLMVLIFFVLFHAAVAQADMAPPPPALYAMSADGGHVVRVEHPKSTDGKPRTTTAIFYVYDAAQDTYVRKSQFDLKAPSEYLYLSRTGKYLIAVNKGHWRVGKDIGIRVYSTDGTLLRQWRLPDILTPEEIAGVTKSSATTWWYAGGEMIGDRLLFWGPTRFSSDRGGGKPYRFVLDPEKLELTREPAGS